MSRIVDSKTEQLAALIQRDNGILSRLRARWPQLAERERTEPPCILTGGQAVILPHMGWAGQITVGIHYFLNDPEFRPMVMKIAVRL